MRAVQCIAACVVALAGCRINFDLRTDDAGLGGNDVDSGLGVGEELTADARRRPPDAWVPRDAPSPACPPSYVAAGSSCYRVSLVRANTWLDAELACEADATGAHLATIADADEASVFVSLIAPGNLNDAWIGLSDRVAEGSYRNVTGEAPGYVQWASGEPSSSDCVQFDGVELHASDCATSDEYVCEFDGLIATTY